MVEARSDSFGRIFTNEVRGFFLDSNILVYASDAQDPMKRDRAIEVSTRLESSHEGLISAQVLGEVFVNLTRRSGLGIPAEEAQSIVETIASSFPVLEVNQLAVEEAIRLSGRYQLAYWDALIIATAKLAGARTVLSEDLQDGQLIEGVRILNPLLPSFELALLGGA